MGLYVPDWKKNADQTYSCPRDWRLSASRGTHWVYPLKPPVYHNTITLKGWNGALDWSPIMPVSQTVIVKFLQFGFLYRLFLSYYVSIIMDIFLLNIILFLSYYVLIITDIFLLNISSANHDKNCSVFPHQRWKNTQILTCESWEITGKKSSFFSTIRLCLNLQNNLL